MQQRHSIGSVIAVASVIVTMFGFGAAVIWSLFGTTSQLSQTQPDVLGVQTNDTQPVAPVVGHGSITGTVTDPAGATRVLQVCAEPTLGGPVVCTASAADGTYQLVLAPGQYTLSAFDERAPTLRGYYTDRGATGSQSDNLIVLDVVAGHQLTDIAPTDWAR